MELITLTFSTFVATIPSTFLPPIVCDPVATPVHAFSHISDKVFKIEKPTKEEISLPKKGEIS